MKSRRLPPKKSKPDFLKLILENRWFVLSILFWLIFFAFINTVSPSPIIAKILFFVILFLSVFCSILVFTPNIKISLLISLYLTFLVLLLFVHQFSLLNLILLSALFVAIFYLTKK